MNVHDTSLPEVKLIEPAVFADARGFFVETFRVERYAGLGIDAPFVQDNVSQSGFGTLRGLHLQHPRAQGKLVYVIEGSVLDVAVDVRVGSPTFGQHVAVTLEGPVRQQLWIPAGFAHGFCVTSERAIFGYKCTDVYSPDTEITLAWNDPAIGIRWPVETPLLSRRDESAPSLDALRTAGRLPNYEHR